MKPMSTGYICWSRVSGSGCERQEGDTHDDLGNVDRGIGDLFAQVSATIHAQESV